jgi:hypothetical protein
MKKTKYQTDLLENSIERVINTTMRILDTSTHEDSDINYDDWNALKWTVVTIWNDARNNVFKELQEKEEK